MRRSFRAAGPRLVLRRLPGLAALVLALGLRAAPAESAVFRHATDLVIPADTTIDDDLYLAGRHLEILGRVNGSVFAAGSSITVSGYVAGDVAAAGREVRCTGHIAGSVHAAAQRVELDGMVGRDVVAAASDVAVGEGGRIGRDAVLGASRARLGAPVGRNVWIGVHDGALGDSVGGTVWADATDLRLENAAVVAGDLFYTSRGSLSRAPGARVLGRTEMRPGEAEEPRHHRPLGAVVAWLRGLIGFVALGALALLPWRGFTARALDRLARRPGPSLGVGVLVAVLVPVAAAVVMIAGILVGGWWIALFAAVLLVLALMVGYVLASTGVGAALLRRGGRAASVPLALVLGLVIVGLVVKIPLVGALVGLLAMLFGIGALALGARGAAAPGPQAGA